MIRVVHIQFHPAGKLYDFDAGELELGAGDRVVVESERGLGLGLVVGEARDQDETLLTQPLAKVQRLLGADDEKTIAHHQRREKEAYDFCLRRIKERGMEMKLVRVEQLFDGSKAIFYFTADGRVDFRELVKDLAHTFHTRIEMRQIGVRDEAKMVGGIGICGRELCCASFLRDFQPVSVKMAKEQNLALNPSKISGQCGRLLCCLDYEYETYCDLRKNFPKCGKRARTVQHAGVVEKMNILTGELVLKMEDGKLVTAHVRELVDENSPAPQPAPAVQVKPQEPSPAQQQREAGASQQQRRQRPQKVQSAKQQTQHVAPTVPSDSAGGTVSEEKSKKKRRNRRHGHRKPSDHKQNDKPVQE